MTRPIIFDASHLAHRSRYAAPSGIEKIDFAYARYFGLQDEKIAAGIQYGLRRPRVMSPRQTKSLIKSVQSRWATDIALAGDAKLQRILNWLNGTPIGPENLSHRESPVKDMAAKTLSGLGRALAPALSHRTVPEGAIYLNIAQHALEKPFYFSWLSQRQDLQRVFFIHDLLPLQHPEFWPADHLQLFRRRIACVAEHASAIITTSRCVETALREEMTRLGRADIRIFASHFPSPLALSGNAVGPDAALAKANYFVSVNTLEPRKNHLLLLNVWRELARAGASAPKLVLIGKRGWKFDEITRPIERDAGLRSLIIEAAGLSDAGLQTLLAGAKALLAPSFAEGYGLPIVEALTLRTPVIASDIPVFREVSQERAVFRDPNDVPGWLEAIRALSEPASTLSRQARDAANAYVPPSGETYFAAVEAFLASL
jgi:glycosyltransferase involved in cell wall biosynthesis